MSVRRVIFRLDFPPSFDIIDAPGAVMRILDPDSEGFWDQLQDVTAKRLISAEKLSQDGAEFRKVTVEPTTIVLELERANGIGESRFEHDSVLETLLQKVQAVCEAYKIKKLRRAGIRFYYLPKSNQTSEASLQLHQSLVRNEFLSAVRRSVGATKDFGLQFDGEHEDGVSFHLRFGPYFKTEARKYFEKVSESIPGDEISRICDLDLFENNFEMGTRIHPWVKSQVAKFRKTMSEIRPYLEEETQS